MGRKARRLRAFLRVFFLVSGLPRIVPRRYFCAADISQEGHRQGAARARRRNCLPRKIFLHALGSSGLEHARDRNVSEPWRRVHGQLEGSLPDRRTAAKPRGSSEIAVPSLAAGALIAPWVRRRAIQIAAAPKIPIARRV